MISCFKGSATKDWKTDFENTHAVSYTSTSDLSEEGPKISKIVESFKKYDVFKYSAYRTAFKLRTIQKASKLHLVDLAIIGSILKDHNCDSQLLDKTLMLDVAGDFICALYTEASNKIGFAEDPNVMSRLFSAFLQNTFVGEEKPLLLVQMKVTLILLSSAKLSEKHKYLFYHCSSDGIMSKKGLQLLLDTLSKLAEIVGEQVTFGSHLVATAVQNCLRYCKGRITEKRFRKWLSLEPQTLVWLSTLHRIAIAETTEHSVHCDYCQMNPMLGLRYKCLQCMNYNLCQNCFLRGFCNKGHKEGHYMQEFCQAASIWQETKATFNAVKNKLPFVKCPSKAYLSFDEESLCDSTALTSQDSIKNPIKNSSIRKSSSAYIIKELSSIIAQLDEERQHIAAFENAKDDNKIQLQKSPSGSFSDENNLPLNSNIGAQLERLRNLLKCLKTPDSAKKEMGIVSPVPHIPFHKKDHYFESTPLNSAVFPLQSKENLSVFSSQYINHSKDISDKQRNHSSFLSNNCQTFSSSEKENFALSTSCSNVTDQSPSVSLELTKLLNNSSPKSLSARMSVLNGDLSKLSPLYICSPTDLEEPVRGRYEFSPCGLSERSLDLRSTKLTQSTFTLNKDGSLEIMEQELQAMLHQLEELLPQVSFLASDSRVEKEKVISALSEMEEAVQKLSHLSIEISTGSTDL